MTGGGTAGAAEATTAGSVLRGGVWSGASRLIPQLYVFVVSIAAARSLTPEGFGRQSFIAFVELSLILLLAGGLSSALMRYIGDSLGRGRAGAVRRLLAFAWTVEGAAAALGGSVLIGAGLLGADPEGAWVLAGTACAIGILHSVPSSLLVGAQLWRSASIVGLVTGAFSTVAIIVVLSAGGGITGMFAVEAAVSAINLVWTTALARSALASPLTQAGAEHKLQPPAWRELRGNVLRFATLTSYGVVLTLVVWRRSEFFFLEAYSTESELALYSVAYAVVGALIQLPDAAGAVVLPAVATLAGAEQAERIRAGFARVLRLLLLASLPLTAAMLALGPQLLRSIFGAEYAGAGRALLIMIAPFPLMSLLYVSRALLAGLARLRFPLAAETIAAVINVALAFALVPEHGAVGAALANMAAQVVAALLIFAYALRSVGAVEWNPFAISRAAVVSAAAGLAAWGTLALVGGTLGLVAGFGVGLTVFAALAVAVRILPAEDAAWLESTAGASFAGLVGFLSRRLA